VIGSNGQVTFGTFIGTTAQLTEVTALEVGGEGKAYLAGVSLIFPMQVSMIGR
jgi:hypothetical protein